LLLLYAGCLLRLLSCSWVFYSIFAAGVGLPFCSVFSPLVLLQIILEWFCFSYPPLPYGGCIWVIVLIMIAAELVWFAGVVALLLTALALMVWFVCSLSTGLFLVASAGLIRMTPEPQPIPTGSARSGSWRFVVLVAAFAAGCSPRRCLVFSLVYMLFGL
jgi:hypothetical protein